MLMQHEILILMMPSLKKLLLRMFSVYVSREKRLVVLQIRSLLVREHRSDFLASLVDWMTQCQFSNTVLLSSCHRYGKRTQFFYSGFTPAKALKAKSSMFVEGWQEEDLGTSSKENDGLVTSVTTTFVIPGTATSAWTLN